MSRILLLIDLPHFNKHVIRFARIGKKSKAHKLAYAVYNGRQSAQRTLAIDILELL
ncbi:hypothetical protein HYR54_15960 [Candidatus Acetothermia bacterium]|nr:hypothetical protein [Candidatus Acetothermia bacterium]